MFASSILFSALASMALVSAAPVARSDDSSPPPGWAYGYLEKYDAYHTRYIALDCQDKHDTDFFDQCCHPLLASETLEDARPAQCIPDAAASASAKAVAATQTGDDSDGAESQFVAATSTVSEKPKETAKSDDNNDDSSNNNNNNNNNNNGGGEQTGGYATFFYQNGNAGACGNYHSDSDKIVAIDIAWYQNTGSVSPYCGQWVTITNDNNGKTVTAQIQDVCPTCANGNSLDLSTGAFNAIASPSEGSVPISWSFA